MMIDTIFFDFIGVLLFPKEDDKVSSLVDEIDHWIGSVTDDNIFKEQVFCQYHLSDHEFKNILVSIVNKYEPYAPLWTLLPKIRKSYKIGIINNGTYLTYPLFEEKYRISQQFDLFLSSALEGIRKPDCEIYRRACKKIGSEPQNCLFMDDNKENTLGAQSIGMQTIHWPDKSTGFQAFRTIYLEAV